MKIVNLLPHEFTLYKGDEKAWTIPSQGCYKVPTKITVIGQIHTEDGFVIDVTETTFIDAETILPPPKEGTIYIVPFLVCMAAPEREDLYVPSQSVRRGRMVEGVRSLSKNPFYKGG